MKHTRLIFAFIPFVLLIALTNSQPANAAAPVEELGGPGTTTIDNTQQAVPGALTYPTAASPPPPINPSSNDPYYRMQVLQEELRQLRGMIEEQAHELAQLKKRQQEDYLDLDQRLSSSVPNTAGPLNNSDNNSGIDPMVATHPQTNVGDQVIPPLGSSNEQIINTGTGAQSEGGAQKRAYDHAYGLLKARKIDEVKIALNRFLQDYPPGPYTANAHYWLGEVYLLGNELAEAETQFLKIVEKYPGHRKVSDATFKLGKVYHLQNKPEQAQVLLERVAVGSGSASRLAQDYLLRNF